MAFSADIADIYRRFPHNILPFIGQGYEQPRRTDLRTMVVGINAYSKYWQTKDEAAFAGWFCDGAPPFFSRAYKQSAKLAKFLAGQSALFRGLDQRSSTRETFYATNAIKVYLSRHYRYASRLTNMDYQRHVVQWRAELDAMAQQHAFPHLIVVFSTVFWPHAWKALDSLDAPSYQHFKVTGLSVAKGEACYYARLITIQMSDGTEQRTALVRMHHPAAKGPPRRADWLMREPGFLRLVGVPDPDSRDAETAYKP